MIFTDSFSDEYPFLKKYTSPVKKAERQIVGRDVEMDRIMAAMLRPELCNVMLLAEAGSGKAQPVDTWIPVADDRGYVRLGSIKVGDFVFNENGDPVKVIGVFPQGLKRAYRVEFADGTSTICNNEHLWAARTRHQHNEDQPYSVHTLQDMIDYGIVRIGKRSTRKDVKKKMWYVPRNKGVKRESVDLPIDPYVLGVLIGDGCLTDRPLTISSDDEYVVKMVAGLIGAKGYVRSLHNYGWHFLKSEPDDGVPVSYIQTHELAKLLDADDAVFGRKSIERRIPKKYLIGSVEQRMKLLHGLMDTDGCVTGTDGRINVSFSTNSEGLCKDVCELAASLGYRTSVNKELRHDDLHVNVEYSVYFKVSDETALDLFDLPRHKEWIYQHVRHDKKFHCKYDDIAISSVTDLGYDTDMMCIYVDCPSHLYQTGKEHIVTHNTALVQGTMLKDDGRYYLEVDLSHMISDLTDANQMADRLKTLFDETERYCKTEHHEIVLFIDEFHQIVQLSPAAVEVLKPLLADSGTRGIRVIAATTYVEFRKWISPNQPLVERLQRINLEAPSKKMVVQILRGMAQRYGVDNQFYDNHLFELIYEYTNRYIPANAQPRKSILVLDSMVGWYRYKKRKLNTHLLADVIYESEGVNVAFRVDATTIKKELDAHVFAQDFATKVIQDRLQICVADLNDKSRPMASFLFSGASGTGKTEITKQLSQILFNDSRRLIRFDMTEYANEDSLELFKRELTARVWERPYSIILLDEIEKACAPVTRVLLQVLDDGRLSDENNREVSFVNSYIIMTTNAGSEVYKDIAQYAASDTGDGGFIRKYEKLIRDSISTTTGTNKFPPELLGRIDSIVPFQPLSQETQIKIVTSKLVKLCEEVRDKHNVQVVVSPKVVDYIVKDNLDTDSNSGGARAAVAKINSEVVTAVSAYINANPDVKSIMVDVKGDMAFMNKSKLESNAYIVVRPYRSR